jgi:transcription elongation factor GreA
MSGNYISEEKKKSLEKELEELRGSKRKEIVAALSYAKSLGDLSENAEYHQAREEQAKLEGRIENIEKILRSSQIISVVSNEGGTIDIGSQVIVQREGTTDRKIYQIVGSQEADISLGKISNQSPFGEALLGKKKGDQVSFKVPNRMVNYKIIEVS